MNGASSFDLNFRGFHRPVAAPRPHFKLSQFSKIVNPRYPIISSMPFSQHAQSQGKEKNCTLKWEWGKIRIVRTNDLVNCVDETNHSYNRGSQK